MEKLQNLLKNLLETYIKEIEVEKWFGKERELLNRFVFNNLAKSVNKNKSFFDLAQIGVEVRVNQVTINGKNEVCKDLIIWKEPNQTAWSSSNIPLCIIEWKHGNKKPSNYDIEWLVKFTNKNPECFGIALNIETKPRYKLNAVLIEEGSIKNKDWISHNK